MCTKPQNLVRYNKSIKGKENGGNENEEKITEAKQKSWIVNENEQISLI